MFQPEALWGVGIVVLLVVLIWGVSRNSRRNRALDPMTEAATRAEYDRPDTYDDGRKSGGPNLPT